MISAGRRPPIAVLSFFTVGISEVRQLRKAKKRRQRQQKKKKTERRTSTKKNDIPHTNSFIFFFLKLNLSFFVSHEAFTILYRTTKFHIQERAY